MEKKNVKSETIKPAIVKSLSEKLTVVVQKVLVDNEAELTEKIQKVVKKAINKIVKKTDKQIKKALQIK